jgi:hypothetical protein
MPVVPDSPTGPDVLPNLEEGAGPVGENPQADAEPSGGDGLPDDSLEDIGGDIGGGLGGDIGGALGGGESEEEPPTPEEILNERSQKQLKDDVREFLLKELIKTEDVDKFLEDVKTQELKSKLFNYLFDRGWIYKQNLENQIETYGGVNTLIDEVLSSTNTDAWKDIKNNSSDVYLSNNNSKEGFLMSKTVLLKDGVLTDISEDSKKSQTVLDDLALSIRKAKSSIKKFKEAKIRVAGIKALKEAGEEMDFGSPAGVGPDFEMGAAKDDVAGAISELANAINNAMNVIQDLGVGMGADELDTANGLIDSANNLMGEGAELIDDEEESEEESPEAPESEDGSAEEVEEEEDDEKEASENSKESKEEKKAENVLEKIRKKLAEFGKKEAAEKSQEGYPFKDKLKQNVNDPGFNKAELGPEAPKDKLSPKLRGEADSENLSAKKESIDVELSEKLRHQSIESAYDKSRVSVELASQQQLKGLIPNPLKEALVKGFEEYGVDKKDAMAIVHNAYIEAYEESQKNIIKEAFDVFITKGIEEFSKIAKFVKEYEYKFASDEESEEESSNEAGEEKTAALRGTPTSEEKADFTGYWNDVRKRTLNR